MFPVGSFQSMINELSKHEFSDIPVTIGILVVDYRQSVNREYILNYLKRFDYKSDSYINFYLPGYLIQKLHSTDSIRLSDKIYYFSDWIYEDFLKCMEEEFGIDYPYRPELILMEYEKGKLRSSKKIIIELDSEEMNIKKTGELFEKIFDIARFDVAIEEFSNKLNKKELKENLFDSIISGIGNSFLSSAVSTVKGIKKYGLK